MPRPPILDADLVSESLREWAAADLKESPRQYYDIGKFFFSVSIGTIGAITALKKGSAAFAFTFELALSFAFIGLSVVLALVMILPSEQTMPADADLQDAHRKQVRWVITYARSWFALWAFGTICGVISLFDA